MGDKPLGAGLKLFIVNISLENVLHTCHYKENKNIHTYIIEISQRVANSNISISSTFLYTNVHL